MRTGLRRGRRRRGSHRRRPTGFALWRRRILRTVAALVVIAALGAGALVGYAEYRFHQIHREAVPGLQHIVARNGHPASQSPYNILLVGDNCRNCLDGSQAGAFGSAAEVGGGRSDVTMLLHVDPAKNSVAILSIPRDLWLPIPDSNGEIRVDAALNNGPGALVTTIEDALNIPINHYIELNFDTFQDVVNAVGGINMDFPTRAYDSYSGLNVPAGCYHLNGFQALEVARARHFYYQQNGQWQYDGLGDISRIQRDHEFLKVLASSVAARGLSNPITDNNLVGAVAKDFTIDNTFTLSGLVSLAQLFSRVNIGTAPQATLAVDEDNSPNGFVFQGEQYGDVVFPTYTSDRASITAFLGEPLTGSNLSPATLPVRVLNGSGISGQQTQVSAELGALGFPESGTGTTAVQSTPAESVVYYAPGHEPAAQRLADDLGGAVALGQDATIAGTGLTLVTGSNLTVAVAPRPVAATIAGPSGAATPAATPKPSAQVPSAQVPSAQAIGGVTQSNPTYPSFDPTACPAGAAAPPLPTLPVPATWQLPQT